VGVVVLGGLLFGPFGMLFGNQIGASLGAQNALNKARQEELARMGVNQEMLDTAQEIGFAISQSIKGLEATKQSLWTHQSLARPIDRKVEEVYGKALSATTENGKTDRAFVLAAHAHQVSTLVYAQHDMCLGKYLPRIGQKKVLYGAKSSAEDDKLRSRGKTVAHIQGLDNPNLRFGVLQTSHLFHEKVNDEMLLNRGLHLALCDDQHYVNTFKGLN
jgi:hypothetical protein